MSKFTFLIIKKTSNNDVKSYDFNNISRYDLYHSFAEFAKQLSELYVDGTEITVYYKDQVLTYKCPTALKWSIVESDKPTRSMIYTNGIGQLLLEKQRLERVRPYGWYNTVYSINQILVQRINQFNNNQIKNLTTIRFNVKQDFVSRLCYDISVINKIPFNTYNPRDVHETRAQLNKMAFEERLESTAEMYGSKPLTAIEKEELYNDAVKYGVVEEPDQIGSIYYNEFSRYTPCGFTTEPMLSLHATEGYYDAQAFKRGDFSNTTVTTRSHKINNTNIEQIQYKVLKYFKQFGEAFLIDGYHICPECGEVYHEEIGCSCGYCKPLEFTNGDLLTTEFEINELDVDRILEKIKNNKKYVNLLSKHHITLDKFKRYLIQLNKNKTFNTVLELLEQTDNNVETNLNIIKKSSWFRK